MHRSILLLLAMENFCCDDEAGHVVVASVVVAYAFSLVVRVFRVILGGSEASTCASHMVGG